jgi:trigger factor
MEITLNKQKGTEGSIKIKLAGADYQTQVEKKLGDYTKKASIKGFRPGKVPAGVVKKMFGKSILVEEINLKILGEPLPNLEKSRLIDWDNQKDFEFEYEIGIVEDFKYELSDKVKVKSYPIELDKKIVDDTLEDLRKRFGKVEYPETSAIGDNVYGDLREKNGRVWFYRYR